MCGKIGRQFVRRRVLLNFPSFCASSSAHTAAFSSFRHHPHRSRSARRRVARPRPLMMRIISASNQISFLVALLMLLFSSLPFSVYIFPLKGRNVEENFQRKNRRNERHIELESSYNLRHSNGKQIKFLSTHLFFLLLFHSHSNSNKMKNHFHHPHSAHNVWIFIASYVSVVQSEFGIQCRRMCERKKAVNMIITCH